MAAPVLMPKLGLTMEVGTVVRWRKSRGDAVRAGEVLCEVETDKIAADVESPQDGILLDVIVPEGAEVKVLAVLAVVGVPGEVVVGPALATEPAQAAAAAPAAAPAASPDAAAAAGQAGDRGGPRITPRARKLMGEKGVAADAFAGSKKERITEADVLEHLAALPGGEPSAGLRPMSRIEKLVAARMTESFRDVPQFSVRVAVSMDRLLGLFPPGTVGLNALVLRAVALALSRFPDVQFQYRPGGIFQPHEVNIGFAVAAGRDLLVPVIRRADGKKAAEIEKEAGALAQKARTRALSAEDLSGGTFTVSNLGMFGIDSFTPIVNPGEGAILGVGTVQSIPVIRDGAVAPGRVMELTLTCDHRCVSGATGAEFCRVLKAIFETEEAASW